MSGSDGGRRRWARAPRAAQEAGATAVEYALIAALIAAVIAAIVGVVGQQVQALFASVPVPFA